MAAVLLKQSKKKPKKPKRRPPLAEQPYDISEGVTQSMIGTYCGCRIASRHALNGWRSTRSKEAMQFGSLFHWLLEHLYNMVIAKEIKGWKDAVAAFEPLLKEWWKFWKRTKSESALPMQKMELLTAQAEGVWPGYCRNWYKDFTKVKWLALEARFDETIDGYRRRGMLDGLRDYAGLWLLETKTKGRIPESLADTLSFDLQNQYYLQAAGQMIKRRGEKRRLQGVLYNIVRRPQIQPDKKTGSLKTYVKRIQEDTKTRPQFYYQRNQITYEPAKQKAFRAEILSILQEFDLWLQGKLATYHGRKACTGNYTCEFLASCATGKMKDCEHTGRLFEELEE